MVCGVLCVVSDRVIKWCGVVSSVLPLGRPAQPSPQRTYLVLVLLLRTGIMQRKISRVTLDLTTLPNELWGSSVAAAPPWESKLQGSTKYRPRANLKKKQQQEQAARLLPYMGR